MERISGDGEYITGVWSKPTKDDEELWEAVFDPDSGVDILYSDTPIEAM